MIAGPGGVLICHACLATPSARFVAAVDGGPPDLRCAFCFGVVDEGIALHRAICLACRERGRIMLETFDDGSSSFTEPRVR
jgi:hypothetical protein